MTSAVDDDGRYESSVGPALAGLRVLDEGTKAILDMLRERDGSEERTVPAVLHETSIRHSYPYDWRTNQPVILRATKQWFIDTHALRDQARRCASEVKIFPHDEQGKKNLMQQLERPHWCISRQRVWGVPLPVFYDSVTEELVQHDGIVEHVACIIEREGSDAWWERSEKDLLPLAVVHDYERRGQPLPKKGRDILDIWMDSGVTWQELESRTADLVIEGQDQYRGWFQSTLLTSVADRGSAPYKRVLVHGFTVDKHGLKMSKSAGNVISPDTITRGTTGRGLGTDLLRWWVCRTGTLHGQPTCSDEILVSYANEVKRLRALIRLMLGCISDYNPSTDAPSYEQLHLLDRYFLHQLFLYDQTVWLHYNQLQYHGVAKETVSFMVTQLSQLYVPAMKHRLYCWRTDSTERRSVQYVLHSVLQCIQTALTPVLPFITHDVARYLKPGDSPQLKTRRPLPLELYSPSVEEMVQPALRVRERLCVQHSSSVLASLPTTRLDLALAAHPPVLDQLLVPLSKLQPEPYSNSSVLCNLLQVASVTLTHPTIETPLQDELAVTITLSESPMRPCLRCRRYCATPPAELCGECAQFLQDWNEASSSGSTGGTKDELQVHPSQVGR
ncbi:Aminoacyl-tRNA synthetase class Ia [Trinorchestia longiramus]|nr:Aminoacyl-tRNA synthetase class Ia [Trinorchestia longiramus]